MKFIVHLFISDMMIKKIFQKSKKFLTKTTTRTQRTRHIGSCKIDGRKDVMLFQDTDISLEIMIDDHKLVNRDVEYIDVADRVVVIISKLSSGLHHVEECNRELSGNGICRLFRRSDLSGGRHPL